MFPFLARQPSPLQLCPVQGQRSVESTKVFDMAAPVDGEFTAYWFEWACFLVCARFLLFPGSRRVLILLLDVFSTAVRIDIDWGISLGRNPYARRPSFLRS